MKDHGSAWTLLGAALFSLESLDRIFNVLNVKNMANITHFHLLAIPPPLIHGICTPSQVGLKDPVRRNEGPWIGMDLDGGSSFVLRVP